MTGTTGDRQRGAPVPADLALDSVKRGQWPGPELRQRCASSLRHGSSVRDAPCQACPPGEGCGQRGSASEGFTDPPVPASRQLPGGRDGRRPAAAPAGSRASAVIPPGPGSIDEARGADDGGRQRQGRHRDGGVVQVPNIDLCHSIVRCSMILFV